MNSIERTLVVKYSTIVCYFKKARKLAHKILLGKEFLSVTHQKSRSSQCRPAHFSKVPQEIIRFVVNEVLYGVFER